jgi:DNA-binding NarL/FixJ family response regulator
MRRQAATSSASCLSLLPGPRRAGGLALLTRCLLALDRVDDAARAAAHVERLAAQFGLPLAQAQSDAAHAAVALQSGDPGTAAELAQAAVHRAEEVGAVLDAARARTLTGRALAAAGERDAAVDALEQAAARFRACGAVRQREDAERELRRLGHAVQRRGQPGLGDGIGALSGREREIAKLVVDRRTNREIAEELFLSIKTVETHLRNIFQKLGAASRTEVARIMERSDVA